MSFDSVDDDLLAGSSCDNCCSSFVAVAATFFVDFFVGAAFLL